MARVWFVRRQGAQWIAPGGNPAFELPLEAVVFPLDLGTHRRLVDEYPLPAPELPEEAPEALQRVMVQVTVDDLARLQFSGFEPGVYDSPFPPRLAAQRLSSGGAVNARKSA